MSNAQSLSPTLDERGQALRELVADGLVWDNHACMPLRPKDRSFLPMLEQCRSAGIDVVTLPIGYGTEGIAEHIQMLSMLRDWIAEQPDLCQLVLSIADIAQAKREGRIGVCFDIEGMNAVADQPDLVRLYYDLGVRWMLVAYNKANAAGGGCLDEVDGGLTDLGRSIITKMNEVGMVLCCTHAGYRTVREAIDHSSAPMIFSHSNPRGVYDHPRNIPDDLILACARRGGVIGINGIGIFLGENDASPETFIRHVEYVLDLVGDEHVGIGTDYCFDQAEVAQALAAQPEAFPESLFPRGVGMRMLSPWDLSRVARLLADRGHSEQTLRRLFGGNHLRVANEVWR